MKRLGFGALDPLTDRDWPMTAKRELACLMGMPTDGHDFIRIGLNDHANHPLVGSEDEGATINLETFNSQADHRDFMGEWTSFGLQLMFAANQPMVRLLHDIYYTQIT